MGRVMDDLIFAANVRAALALLRERQVPAVPWVGGKSLPWDEPAFSQRMLQEHIWIRLMLQPAALSPSLL